MKLFFILLVSTFPLFAQLNDSEKTKIKPALLVIDTQNNFMKFMDDQDVKLAPEIINGAIMYFRHYNFPVIRIYHTDQNWGPKEGSEEFKFDERIQISEEDTKFVKNFPSAFKNTDLNKYLKEKGINTLFLCGLSATGCVLATYRAGEDLDYNVFLIKEALMDPDKNKTDFIEDICETVGWKTLGLILELSK